MNEKKSRRAGVGDLVYLGSSSAGFSYSSWNPLEDELPDVGKIVGYQQFNREKYRRGRHGTNVMKKEMCRIKKYTFKVFNFKKPFGTMEVSREIHEYGERDGDYPVVMSEDIFEIISFFLTGTFYPMTVKSDLNL